MWFQNAHRITSRLKGGMLVFVEDAAEPVSSADAKLIESTWSVERLGHDEYRDASARSPSAVLENLQVAGHG
jgi:hypothetical protein